MLLLNLNELLLFLVEGNLFRLLHLRCLLQLFLEKLELVLGNHPLSLILKHPFYDWWLLHIRLLGRFDRALLLAV